MVEAGRAGRGTGIYAAAASRRDRNNPIMPQLESAGYARRSRDLLNVVMSTSRNATPAMIVTPDVDELTYQSMTSKYNAPTNM